MYRIYNKASPEFIPSDAVYVGRPSEYGNPFSHKDDTLADFKVKTVDEAINKFEEYLLGNQSLMDKVKSELKGKSLVCWCYPNRCHAEILIRYANSDDFFF